MFLSMNVTKTRFYFGRWENANWKRTVCSLHQEVRCVLDKEVEKFPYILFHFRDMVTDAGAKFCWERTAIMEETVS